MAASRHWILEVRAKKKKVLTLINFFQNCIFCTKSPILTNILINLKSLLFSIVGKSLCVKRRVHRKCKKKPNSQKYESSWAINRVWSSSWGISWPKNPVYPKRHSGYWFETLQNRYFTLKMPTLAKQALLAPKIAVFAPKTKFVEALTSSKIDLKLIMIFW